MRYLDFRSLIQEELRSNPDGLTWAELKGRLRLPYTTPCYTWIARMEQEIGLSRSRGPRGMIWRVADG